MEDNSSSTIHIVLIGAMVGNAILLAGAMTWVCLRAWAGQRRFEREAFYRSELYRQMLERGELTLEKHQEARRQDEAAAFARARRALRVAGVLCIALAAGVLAGFWTHDDPTPRRIAIVPLSLGLAMVAYASIGPRSNARRES